MTMIEHLITSTVLMLCILLIRMLFGNRMSQRLKYGLWIFVVVKLLVPLPLYETDFSIMNVVQFVEEQIGNEQSVNLATKSVSVQSEEGKKTAEKQEAELEKSDMQKSETQNGNHTDVEKSEKQQLKLKQEEAIDSVNTGDFSGKTKEIPFKTLCVIIWLAGVILLGSIFVFSNSRFYFQLKKDRKETTIYPSKLRIYETSCVDSPCLFGLINPAIYLPAGLLLGEEKMKHIMTHELTHYKHKDHIWSYIRCLCLVIYWYHPLVWLAAFLSVKDSELACDEGAVKCLGEEHRKAYGVTLIEMASGTATVSNRLVCSTSIMGGKKEMKERIEMLVKKPKMLVSTFAAFLVLVIGVTGCTFSSAKKEVKTETEAKTDVNVVKTKEKDKTDEPEAIEQTEKPEETLRTTPISASLETKIEDVPVGAYCLWFFPDELCFQENFVDGVNSKDGVYYVPDETMQKKIQKLLENPEKTEKIPTNEIGDGEEHVESAYSLRYKKNNEEDGLIYYRVYEDDTIEEDDTIMKNSKLRKYLSNILKDEFQYEPLDVTTIKNIESATLEYVHPETKKQYSQTIKEKEILDKFEDWFSNAKACYSGDRPYFNGLLTLELKNGNVVKLTMASTGVPYFGVNGELYDYEPQNKTEGFDAYAVFECFDKIPYYNYSE